MKTELQNKLIAAICAGIFTQAEADVILELVEFHIGSTESMPENVRTQFEQLMLCR